MRPFTLTYNYDTQSVEIEGDICPDTIFVLGKVLEHLHTLKDTMKMSRELGNVPFQHDVEMKIMMPPKNPADPKSN